MGKKNNWFEVDKTGLAKLREDSPKSALVDELIQNCWDTNAKTCTVTLKPDTRGVCCLRVEDDDPDGFADLSHSYTIFAESVKKSDPEKRGRFNLGEKLVLALCIEARVESTKGAIYFGGDGNRIGAPNQKREKGSVFTGWIKMRKDEIDEIEKHVLTLLPPEGCLTTFNGHVIESRLDVLTEATLPTVIGDTLRPTRRKTKLEILEPREGEAPMLYEMGIPVVESGDKYHVNVYQKIPLTLDRTNVTPAFLREVRCAVAEAMVGDLTQEDANQSWVRVAASDPDASKDLVTAVWNARFGEDAVIYDPSDAEANQRALADGRTVVFGGHLNKDEWANVRAHGVASPAGKVYTQHKIDTSPDGKDWVKTKDPSEGMLKVVEFTKVMAKRVLGKNICVELVSEPTIKMSACYFQSPFGSVLRWNVGTLGRARFDKGMNTALLSTMIHEFAHETEGNHLDPAFYAACTWVGACVAVELAKHPDLWEDAQTQ